MSIFSGLFKSRDKPSNRSGGTWGFLFGGSTSGKAVNERTAMQTSAVYACVRILSESIAGLPLHVYRYTSDGGKERIAYHPLYRLLHDEPNPEMTSFVFRETLMAHLLLWGNAYAQVVRNGLGQPMALYPLLPSKMDVSRSKSGELLYTYYRDWDESGNRPKQGGFTMRKDEILHIPGLGFDGLIGYSPIAMAKNAIGMALATEEYGAAFFANGANPGGVLEHPGVIKPEQADRLRESWQSQFGGSNAHKVAVLEEGLKFHQMSIPPEQAQFLETRKFQINEIARIFRVPPHMVGDLEKSSFSNIEQQSLEFVKYTLDPWVVRWEQSLQQSLVLPSEKSSVFVRFNLDGLLRGDYQSRMQGYSVGIQNGFYSVNDVRGLEDMNLLSDADGGNLHVLNGNMVKLADVGAAYKTTETEETP
jgi:HK97 family phage portal protein